MLSRRIADRTVLAQTILVTQVCGVHHHKERHDLELFLGIRRSNTAKANRNTHINEKLFRRARAEKTLRLDLPDDVEVREREKMTPNELRLHFLRKGINPYKEVREREKMTPNELRLHFLRKGINPYKEVQPRQWTEHQSTLQSFYGVIDPYIPNKYVTRDPAYTTGDKRSIVDKTKDFASHQWHNYNGGRRIKKKEGMEKFDPKKFGPTAEAIYVDAHKALMSRNKDQLHKLITELAFVKMWPDVENGSIFWELVRFNEPSKVVSVRCADNPHKSGNDIAQLTVRMNSTQKLAIYDRFGKLLLGSETEEKDVIEYVVFENHVAIFESKWRLHDKIYPDGIAPKQAPVDPLLLENLPENEVLRPEASVPIKLRMNERIKEELKSGKKEED
uniref:Tim44-like domain-containing protein n=1 Tax=Panagrolaimus sp. JU765 TaxID=591449 RepID=A0AC34QLI3_9BILA